MKITRTLYAKDRNAWREWLEKNFKTELEIWLIYYKKGSGQPRIPYDDAVEEALCFGWIDSIIQKIDEEKFAQKFTPRKNHAKWSALNIQRMHKLIVEGKMTPTGLAKIEPELLKQTPPGRTSGQGLALPEFLEAALRKNEMARRNFNNLAPSYRRNYIGWISDAKTDLTREKRIKEALGLLEQNKKLGMK